MLALIDRVLVGLVLLASLGYALTALGPRALRRRIASMLAAVLRRLPSGLAPRGLAQRLELASTGGGACGGCDNCGSEPRAAPPHATQPEVRVPLSKISRRR